MPNETDLRILLLSAAVPQTWYAGSLLLYRLLRDYPPHLLKAVGPRPQPSSETLACDYVELQPAASSRLDVTRLAQLKRSLEAVSLLGRIPDSRVERAVGAFAADIVISVMERFDYVDAAHRYCQRHGLPLVLIVHDRLESFDRVYPAFAGAQRRRIASIYRDAAVRFCVSPEMEQCLAREYGAPGTVLYPNRSDDLAARPLDDSLALKSDSTLTIGYAGAMNYGYGDAIAAVMPVLDAAGIGLRAYSREAPRSMPGVTYGGAFRHTTDLWSHLKSECDLVWLPYSSGDTHRTLYETHFPSKLAEYLALGMPIVITGPDYATGVRWGLRNPGAALTVANGTPDQIHGAFERLRNDPTLRRQLAEGASRAADGDFNPNRIRDGFMAALRSQVRQGAA